MNNLDFIEEQINAGMKIEGNFAEHVLKELKKPKLSDIKKKLVMIESRRKTEKELEGILKFNSEVKDIK